MSFSFVLTIDPSDLEQLISNKYSLAAVKHTSGSPQLIQWFSIPVEGNTNKENKITVSWGQEYDLIYTTSSIEPSSGKPIVPSSTQKGVPLGKSYKYEQAWFSESTKPAVTSTQIGVLHDYPQGKIRKFGINQLVQINGQPQKTVAISVVPVPFVGGSAVFDCSKEQASFYFAPPQSAGAGLVLSSLPAPNYTVAFLPDQPQYATFSKGKWIPGEDPPTPPPGWDGKFKFTLSAPINFSQWIEKTIGNVSAEPETSTLQSAVEIDVSSEENRTEAILALKGQSADINGLLVKVLDVQEIV